MSLPDSKVLTGLAAQAFEIAALKAELAASNKRGENYREGFWLAMRLTGALRIEAHEHADNIACGGSWEAGVAEARTERLREALFAAADVWGRHQERVPRLIAALEEIHQFAPLGPCVAIAGRALRADDQFIRAALEAP